MARTTEAKVATRPVPRPAKAAAARRMPAFVERVAAYLREIWVELNRVDWPTRTELVRMSIVVLVVLVVLAIYLGIFDYIYTVLVKRWLMPPVPR
jgi:preprotein translocase subunit SecE